jgi:hypothetical protein
MEYWKVGDRAFAYWEADEYYYPATITDIEEDEIHIRYDSGEEEVTNADYLEDLTVEVGEEVECASAEDGEYYSAWIAEVTGEQVRVTYEDDTEETTTMSNIRNWYEEAEE